MYVSVAGIEDSYGLLALNMTIKLHTIFIFQWAVLRITMVY